VSLEKEAKKFERETKELRVKAAKAIDHHKHNTQSGM
jgi:hypothetical protein